MPVKGLKKIFRYFNTIVLTELKGLLSSSGFKILALIILCISLFHDKIISLYDKFVVTGLLQEIKSSDWSSYLLLLLSVFLIISSVRNIIHNKKVSFLFLLYIIFIAAFYVSYRNSENYIYAKFTIKALREFNYADIIILYCCVITIEFTYATIKKLFPPKYNNFPFEVDTPISDINLDLFGRKQFAEEIAKKIKCKYDNRSSLAIGIDGPWGSGKTSFVKMIRNYLLQDEGITKRIIIEFHPWKSSSPQQIIEDFFSEFTSEIRPYSSTLSNKISDYAASLTKVDENLLSKSTDAIVGLLESNKSKESKYNLINTALENFNNQIIVIIDDIDRLDKKEIIEVVRLIRNTASFHNTIFIVTYEREYVLNAIKELNEHRFPQYLEKIFQFEFTLPSFEKSILKNELLNKIIGELNDDHKAPFNSILFPTAEIGSPPDLFERYIKTYRDVIRYVNSFLFDYKLIKEEIDVEDFSLLQLLKLKYPDVYDLLIEKRSVFLKSISSTYFQDGLEYILRQKKQPNEKDEDSKTELYYYLIGNCHSVKYKECEIGEIVELVNSMFNFDINSIKSFKKNQKSISIIDNFYKYFANRVFNGEISINEFMICFAKPLEEFKRDIDRWIEKDLLNDIIIRISRLNISDLKSRDEFEKLVKAIFYFGAKTAKAGSRYLVDTGKLYNMLQHDEKSSLVRNWYNNDFQSYQNFIKSLFTSAINPYSFESWFILIIMDKHWGYFILDEKFLKEQQLDYLKKYLTTVNHFDENVWSLIYNNKLREKYNVQANSFQMRDKPNPSVKPLILEFIEKNNLIDEFILRIIRYEPFEEVLLGIYAETIRDVFESLDLFEEYIRSSKSKLKSKYLGEFMEFYSILKSRGFRYMDYTFKTIPTPVKRIKY